MPKLAYPAILDCTDIPAVFRSVRCPRPNYALAGKPEPERDLLKRIAQLAGESVARQIVKEFGGKAIHIRLSYASNMVCCRDCGNATLAPPMPYGVQTASCLIKKVTSQNPNSRRHCDGFFARPVASIES